MAAATEGYVEAQTGRLKAESQADIATALLTLQEAGHRRMLWIIGWMTGLSIGLAGVLIAVLG